jgi:REP element-mobilizing transposase RayT
MGYDPDIHRRRSIRLKGYDYSSGGAYFVTVCAVGKESLFGKVANGEVCLNDAGRTVLAAWNELYTHYQGVQVDVHVVMPNHFHGILMLNDFVGAGSSRPPIPNGSSRPCLENAKDINGIASNQDNRDHGGITPENQGGITPENQGGITPENQGGITPENQGGITPENQGGITPPLRRQPTLGQIVGYFKYRSTKEINEMRGMPPVPVWQRGYYERIIRGEKELQIARRYIQENPLKWACDKENPLNINPDE